MNKLEILPFIPIREIVFFPQAVIPIIVGRDFSKKAIDYSVEHTEGRLVLAIQKDSLSENIDGIEDVETVGVIGKIIQIMKTSDGNLRLIIEGEERIKVTEVINENGMFKAKYENYPIEKTNKTNDDKYRMYLQTLIQDLNIINNKLIPEDLIKSIFEIKSFETLMYTLASTLDLSEENRVEILKSNNIDEIFENLTKALKIRIELEEIDRNVENKVKKNIEDNQRQYYIREKIKGLYSELDEEDSEDEINELLFNIESRELPYELADKLIKEVNRYKKMNNFSAEAGVIRTYIDTMLEIPWEKSKTEDIDIKIAEEILDKEHFGLKLVKDTVLEYLAVNQLNKENNKKMGTILCLIGPPGVGKTSLGESIAHAMNRKFERISLGGVHDESEIRGHRRTYIGAMPGRIIEALKRAKVNNPVILLDEIDKLDSNFKGDPASALLEVLDPAQNKTFKDNYVDFEYDLSDAFFICTANDYSGIPRPLLDRMEVINVDSYTIQEKLVIARNYLVKQAKNETSIKDIKFSDSVLLEIINKYTMEAGVRNLKREIVKILRKIAKLKLEDSSKKYSINLKNLSDYLGPEKYKKDKMAEKNAKLGVVKGLAWTSVGGTTLDVEAVKMDGKGKIQFTGKLGLIMKESASVAYTYARANYKNLSVINPKFYEEYDIHLHFPEGATPKDGPSAGITITTAIVSILSERKVRQNIAMTGEITITGEVLPVGGIKEKVLGAHRIGIREVILPFENKSDTVELPEEILSQIKIHYVKKYSEVEKIVFSE
ncbi:endopeptidase La [Streptobacillus moniliformis]|uniref:Lon protease n=1 Tax=Streptobacillus moniliformis (strain ATCC 14647 / DSM 12112 / NCTC 10651 / 9901) TaxID=519441 RepID=D1AY58_STRM9|nr:endopeptidase La [Streptobacillus moniliformis]ACZ01234.1 ATP-dependent protease La [Streptobacillus moniliformis DSM 12112]SQA13611.1 Lon protease [Streptobacillus moniliformis]